VRAGRPGSRLACLPHGVTELIEPDLVVHDWADRRLPGREPIRQLALIERTITREPPDAGHLRGVEPGGRNIGADCEQWLEAQLSEPLA
jgi:hypothetical protein